MGTRVIDEGWIEIPLLIIDFTWQGRMELILTMSVKFKRQPPEETIMKAFRGLQARNETHNKTFFSRSLDFKNRPGNKNSHAQLSLWEKSWSGLTNAYFSSMKLRFVMEIYWPGQVFHTGLVLRNNWQYSNCTDQYFIDGIINGEILFQAIWLFLLKVIMKKDQSYYKKSDWINLKSTYSSDRLEKLCKDWKWHQCDYQVHFACQKERKNKPGK